MKSYTSKQLDKFKEILINNKDVKLDIKKIPKGVIKRRAVYMFPSNYSKNNFIS